MSKVSLGLLVVFLLKCGVCWSNGVIGPLYLFLKSVGLCLPYKFHDPVVFLLLHFEYHHYILAESCGNLVEI